MRRYDIDFSIPQFEDLVNRRGYDKIPGFFAALIRHQGQCAFIQTPYGTCNCKMVITPVTKQGLRRGVKKAT
jgi:hypothetical protein